MPETGAVSLILGPGQHGPDLARALRAASASLWLVEHWPEPRLVDPLGRRRAGISWYPMAQYAIRAAWRRFSWAALERRADPRWWEARVTGRFAAARLPATPLLWAWSGVSLEAMRRARSAGSRIVLEHPTTHVDAFSALVEDERARWTPRLAAPYSSVPPGFARRMRLEYGLADRIVVLSTFAERSFLEAGVSPARLIRVQLGVDTELFRPGGVVRPAAPRILFVGRIELRKGVQYLLDAVSRLGRRDVEVLLAGPLLPEGEALLSRWKGAPIRCLGHVPRRELPAIYQSSDVVVLPSVDDAFGLVICEALACATPVIATTNSGGPDAITDGHDGWIVPARDSRALAECLADALADRRRLRRMGEAARQKALERFQFESYFEQVAAVARPFPAAQDEPGLS